MKLANGSERLEMHIFNGERKDVEGVTGQPVSIPIVHYDYEPRSRLTSPPKNDAKEISQSMFIGNEGPSVIVKATVCLIALIIMVFAPAVTTTSCYHLDLFTAAPRIAAVELHVLDWCPRACAAVIRERRRTRFCEIL
ncbi:unnamed protein product [Brugia pahangi]|uniref:Transmembrane protein n=2 Tax=Brugia pahangi TaxID=6280 RepID=A0A0N4TZ62_BRUPA|nr:unnamed protein product [Brugia pahangi]